jgi:hypothetical protein
MCGVLTVAMIFGSGMAVVGRRKGASVVAGWTV